MTSPRWTITEYRGPQGLAELRDDWKRLFDSMPHPGRGHLYENAVAYADLFLGESDGFTYLVLGDETGVRGICPLELRTERLFGMPVRVWGLPWNHYWGEADLICADDEAASEFVEAVVDHLRRSADRAGLLVLAALPEHSVALAGLQRLDRDRFCTHVMWLTDIVDCDRPAEALESSWSRNFRSNMRKAHNKLSRLGGVEFVYATTPSDLAAEFETFLHVEASGWKGASGTGTAIALDAHKLRIYRAMVEGPGGVGLCELNSLYAEGKCIASQLCMRAGEEYTSLKIGYDEEHAAEAPGQLLQQHLIERCCADPAIRRFDLVSHYPWHRNWRPRTIPTLQADVAVGRWTGRPLVALFRLQWSVQRLVRRLRARFGKEETRWRGPR